MVPLNNRYTCPHCNVGTVSCSSRQNTHIVTEPISETRTIPEGAPEGYRIVFEGKGNQLPFSRASNVIYTLHYAIPAGYSIQDNDLVYDMKVYNKKRSNEQLSVKESKEIHSYTIETPLGRSVTFVYPGSLQEGDGIKVIEGEGLPIMGHPVKCKQFVVTDSMSKSDQRNRSCMWFRRIIMQVMKRFLPILADIVNVMVEKCTITKE